ncbi:nucleotidyltransferase family protein [Candidatus Amarobacter glycogenicus]|uniref:nucleotidyltransferase family protein n=1 Tax=Candidatus Amarobacter glycogenicus TaxID=3140699 RepID=UPI0031CCD814
MQARPIVERIGLRDESLRPGAATMIAGMVLAAGRSSRMGRLKPLLPWGQKTVIEQVVTTLLTAPLADLLVVTGYEHEALAAVLQGYPLRVVFNPDHAAGEMISSIQVGLRALGPTVNAALIAVGDQPRIQAGTIAAVMAAWRDGPPQRIIIPSYQMRRRASHLFTACGMAGRAGAVGKTACAPSGPRWLDRSSISRWTARRF